MTNLALPSDPIEKPKVVLDQKDYVNRLVDVVALTLEKLWPSPTKTTTAPIKVFLQHILKQSRTTHSTLQLALYYLFRSKNRVTQAMQQLDLQDRAYAVCGRRMFLASLICAQKYLHDKTYKNKAWTQIAGLPVQQINQSERVFLWLLDYQLYVRKEAFDHWLNVVQHQLGMRGVVLDQPQPAPPSPEPTKQFFMAKKHLLPTPPTDPLDLPVPNKKRRTLHSDTF
ncbi:hypothetical protein DM01DRAFT_1341391 [Hesseltinella vesiculosa]|uniref:Cyclin N-terminal domain-containing protein n=1 Tax=Hesseltinella vesiculosa TaxID=101127 RepID=A0A1X2GXF9_9FUNG|nr:hypothetical protein DM01DRAFT_1341391 [Hesseltinella vesiculosa]